MLYQPFKDYWGKACKTPVKPPVCCECLREVIDLDPEGNPLHPDVIQVEDHPPLFIGPKCSAEMQAAYLRMHEPE